MVKKSQILSFLPNVLIDAHGFYMDYPFGVSKHYPYVKEIDRTLSVQIKRRAKEIEDVENSKEINEAVFSVLPVLYEKGKQIE